MFININYVYFSFRLHFDVDINVFRVVGDFFKEQTKTG